MFQAGSSDIIKWSFLKDYCLQCGEQTGEGLKVMKYETSLVVQWLKNCLPMKGMRVRSLVRELRSHMPWDTTIREVCNKEPMNCNKHAAQPKKRKKEIKYNKK